MFIKIETAVQTILLAKALAGSPSGGGAAAVSKVTITEASYGGAVGVVGTCDMKILLTATVDDKTKEGCKYKGESASVKDLAAAVAANANNVVIPANDGKLISIITMSETDQTKKDKCGTFKLSTLLTQKGVKDDQLILNVWATDPTHNVLTSEFKHTPAEVLTKPAGCTGLLAGVLASNKSLIVIKAAAA